jgi:hypothetical protein
MIFCKTDVPIFKTTVIFIGHCSAKEAEEKIYSFEDGKTQVFFSHTAIGGVRDKDGDIFVWVEDLNRASIVAHELAHAACVIMELNGILLHRRTEELLCLLIEWLKKNVQDVVYEEFDLIKGDKQ